MARTPTPWKLALTDDTIIRGPDGSYIAAVTGDYNSESDWPCMEANAAFIVRAVNAHDDLVTALKSILRLQDENDGADFETVFLLAEDIARAALAKAGATS
jgi:hypothetical protein